MLQLGNPTQSTPLPFSETPTESQPTQDPLWAPPGDKSPRFTRDYLLQVEQLLPLGTPPETPPLGTITLPPPCE